ncbi:type I restriction-modification system subunit M [Pseudomonas inefficax]|uniref:type I restriction-modification system subunit M n=1 Tax=Pseudomonas inefficax TaxID=2078786 RepID=UPI002DBA65EB|nr:type I restriction-modification system subunit M [Pseudomonas sp. CMAA1741]MEC4560343.1 type I restriction-modification system subunit M [Pseudomonas sp. CMAA1741]
MTESNKTMLGKSLWSIADQLRGLMNADDFRDYILSLFLLRYLSDNYENAAKIELGEDHPKVEDKNFCAPLTLWYANNPEGITEFENHMRKKIHYVLHPQYIWSNIANMARTQKIELLSTLQGAFQCIELESFEHTFQGLFTAINLDSEKLGRTYAERNNKLSILIQKISEALAEFSTDIDTFGDVYEYLIGQFAAASGKKAGEFYTPQHISDILSSIVTLDSRDPKRGSIQSLGSVMDFACGSGSLLLNIRKHVKSRHTGIIYGQEKTLTTYNLARMNMLIHGLHDTEFQIHHGDTLANDWAILREMNPGKKPAFDIVVANPPLSLRWEPTDSLNEDIRFKNYGVPPKSSADLAFLLHGLHYLKNEGVMAIVQPHGVLFRSGAEERIRTKLLKDGHIDTVIGLPSNLLYSSGIPVCILILKKSTRPDDVLIIDATESFVKGKRQNQLSHEQITKIIDTYRFRREESRYARRVTMEEIKENGYNLNISRYISTASIEAEVDLQSVSCELATLEKTIKSARDKHNAFLKDLGLPPLA